MSARTTSKHHYLLLQVNKTLIFSDARWWRNAWATPIWHAARDNATDLGHLSLACRVPLLRKSVPVYQCRRSCTSTSPGRVTVNSFTPFPCNDASYIVSLSQISSVFIRLPFLSSGSSFTMISLLAPSIIPCSRIRSLYRLTVVDCAILFNADQRNPSFIQWQLRCGGGEQSSGRLAEHRYMAICCGFVATRG